MILFSNVKCFADDLTKFSKLLTDTIGGISCTPLGPDIMEKWGGGTKYPNSYGRFLKINTYPGNEIVLWAGLGIIDSSTVDFVVQFRPFSIAISQDKLIEISLDKPDFNKFCNRQNISILQNFMINIIRQKVEEYRK